MCVNIQLNHIHKSLFPALSLIQFSFPFIKLYQHAIVIINAVYNINILVILIPNEIDIDIIQHNVIINVLCNL